MLVDFALEAERERGLAPRAGDPGGLPRAVPPDHHDHAGGPVRRGAAGARDRHRLASSAARSGIAICGGLIVSQLLTLYTTPVIYLALERLARGRRSRIEAEPVAAE